MTNDIQYLRNDLEHMMEINELKHDTILTKLENLNQALGQRIIEVDGTLAKRTKEVDDRFSKLETRTDTLSEWRIYTIALVTFAAVLVPYVLGKLFP